jgi:hypothetical protein
MTAFAKGVKKVVKKVVKGVKKIYKKITESKLGKALLIGAAIFTGGAALGFWNMPAWIPGAANINGVLTKAGSQAAQAAAGTATTGATAGTAAASTTGTLAPGGGVLQVGQGGGMLAENASQALVKGVMPQAAGGTAANTMAAPTIAAGTAPMIAPTVQAGAQQGQQTIVARLLEGAKTKLTNTAGWVQDHPYASAMMMNSAASMMSPDEQDLMELNWKRQDSELARRNRNMNVSGVDLGVMTPGQQTGLPRNNYWFLNGSKSGV